MSTRSAEVSAACGAHSPAVLRGLHSRWTCCKFSKLLGILALMVAWVSFVGLCVLGSCKQAWRYTRIWLAVVGGLAAVGLVLGALMPLILPPPG